LRLVWSLGSYVFKRGIAGIEPAPVAAVDRAGVDPGPGPAPVPSGSYVPNPAYVSDLKSPWHWPAADDTAHVLQATLDAAKQKDVRGGSMLKLCA
jgi:hypothetical protein